MPKPTARPVPATSPPTLTNKLGTLSRKIFAARSAVEFSDLMEEFRAEHRDQVLTEAAAMLRAHCPQHADGDTAFMSCHCPAATELDRAAAADAPHPN